MEQIKTLRALAGDIITVIVAIIAIIMVLGVMAIYGLAISLWPIYGFMGIILYCLIPRKTSAFWLSLAIIGACVYMVIMLLSVFVYQPVFFLMKIVLATCAVLVLLRRKPWWLWTVVGFIFLGLGIYFLFHNDIKGPMEFMITDRPIDVPAQWNHCYRFFWTGVLLEMITWFASICSIIIIFMYNIYDRYKDKFALQAL
ncbi:MAG: hypothetical protein J6W56_09220 [Prevotella sp.]|nr:hypothetical protein [Prevotella sp.]